MADDDLAEALIVARRSSEYQQAKERLVEAATEMLEYLNEAIRIEQQDTSDLGQKAGLFRDFFMYRELMKSVADADEPMIALLLELLFCL